MSAKKPTTLSAVSQQRVSRSTATSKDRTRTPSKESSQCTSPTKPEAKRLPPIKTPVGLTKGPDLKNVRSKIGSLANVKYQPTGGETKMVTQKLDWQAKSRINSLQNAKHKAGGGEVKVATQKLDWKGTSRVGSLDNVKHRPGGGQIKIFDEKYARSSRSSSEVRSPGQMRSPSPSSTTSGPVTGTVGKTTSASSCKTPNGSKSNGDLKPQPQINEAKSETKSNGEPKRASGERKTSTSGENGIPSPLIAI